jgi:hypothetical protein
MLKGCDLHRRKYLQWGEAEEAGSQSREGRWWGERSIIWGRKGEKKKKKGDRGYKIERLDLWRFFLQI